MLPQTVRRFLWLSFCLIFWSRAYGQDLASPSYEPARAEPKTLQIKSVRLVVWQGVDKRTKLVEVHELLETKKSHLTPSGKFDVECEVVGGEDVLAGDYVVWTSVDFLVAPVTRAYEQMDSNALGSSVAWGQLTEMRDLSATPIYFLKPGEARTVAVKGLDLNPVLAAFPAGEAGEQWPWLVRVTVHVQDRSGKQLASAERTLRLLPSAIRKKSRYDDPLPSQ